MTDEEIKKSLETELRLANYVERQYCENVRVEILKNTLDLINRQQAEIERLEEERTLQEITIDNQRKSEKRLMDKNIELQAMRGAANTYKKHYETAKSEAIKEFAERLENNLFNCDVTGDRDNVGYITSNVHSIIDNLVKEMTEGGVKNEKL